MKKIIRLLVLFSGMIGAGLWAQGQPEFAPLGAEWYYDAVSNVTFRAHVDSSVIKNGMECRRVNYQAIPGHTDLGMPVHGPAPQYIYNTEDTVFIFNELFQEFTPLFIYNVNEGDTVRLPLLQVHCGDVDNPGQLGTFAFVIDSIRLINYDTTPLKTYYYHPLSEGLHNYSWATDMEAGTIHYYTEKVGGFKTGLLPRCLKGCVMNLDATCVNPGDLRCYSDPNTFIQIADRCIRDTTSGIETFPIDPSLLTIYPNPAINIDDLNIHNATDKEIRQVIVYDMYGREVYTQHNGHAISADRFIPGVYLVHIILKSAPLTRLSRQIVIRR